MPASCVIALFPFHFVSPPNVLSTALVLLRENEPVGELELLTAYPGCSCAELVQQKVYRGRCGVYLRGKSKESAHGTLRWNLSLAFRVNGGSKASVTYAFSSAGPTAVAVEAAAAIRTMDEPSNVVVLRPETVAVTLSAPARVLEEVEEELLEVKKRKQLTVIEIVASRVTPAALSAGSPVA
ncbi:hypothetical protein FIBSPDRAFT_903356 [Athelia psychrophila]|uniref:Uncharacterized protein n=1 Tax=Athelia psychrophila TaxID=1759441 RepID=A0A167W413_9AGAM|nr:hypothetical protein FIBSPDRAFT_903356 [Fibularhizoctonia sp. CBS 109695]